MAADLTSVFPSMNQQFSKEIEDEANSYFQRIYNHPPHPTISTDDVIEMLKRFKDSPSKKERVCEDSGILCCSSLDQGLELLSVALVMAVFVSLSCYCTVNLPMSQYVDGVILDMLVTSRRGHMCICAMLRIYHWTVYTCSPHYIAFKRIHATSCHENFTL